MLNAPVQTERIQPRTERLDAPKKIESRGVSYLIEPSPITNWRVNLNGEKYDPRPSEGIVARTKDQIGFDVAVTRENYAYGPEIIQAIETNDTSGLSMEAQKMINDSNCGLSNLCAVLLCHGKITPDQYALIVKKHSKSSVSNPNGFKEALKDGVTGAREHLKMVTAAVHLPDNWLVIHNPAQQEQPYYTLAVTDIHPDGTITAQNRAEFGTVQWRYTYEPKVGFTPDQKYFAFNFSTN